MALIMTNENEPEKCIFNESMCGGDMETSHLMPLPSSAVAKSSDIEASCFYSGAEKGVCYTPETNHGYMYLGYDGSCPEWKDQPYYVSQERLLMPHSGVQAGDDPVAYCTYSAGQVVGFEDQALQQPYLCSTRYNRQVSNLSQRMPDYSWDSNQGAESLAEHKITNVGEAKVLSSGDAGPSNAEDLKAEKSEIKFEIKASPQALGSKVHPLTSSSDFSGHSVTKLEAPQIRPRIQPVGSSQGYNNSAKIPSSSFQRQKFPFPRNTITGSRPIYPTVNSNNLFQIREKSNFNRTYGAPNELVRGPRATRVKRPSSSAVEKDSLNPCVRGDHYNKPDFQVMYDQAQFFMIKSYSEDDIHKSIKYSVWASTPNGNNKLDAAFRKAEMEKIEKGIQCPIFLFFSVNASGQFVGLAEMIGPVDFKKSMDFWQQDKWNGFFPVKWHIIKDIPNRPFQHITLENNENKAVTFSRDTQELGRPMYVQIFVHPLFSHLELGSCFRVNTILPSISNDAYCFICHGQDPYLLAPSYLIRLPQGLSMLQIFKDYQAGTSMLDDFDFYEEKEKSLPAKKSNQPASVPSNVDAVDDRSVKRLESSFGNMSVSARPRRSYAESQYSATNITRRPNVNCLLPRHRS